MASPRKVDKDGTQVVATNRSARHDYTVLDTIEAGIMLRGSEVKSLREAQVQIKEAHARFENGEAWLVGMHIAPYLSNATHDVLEPDRKRKLLMRRSELDRLRMRVDIERLSLVPALALLQGRPGQGRAGPGPGPQQGRQAPGHRRARLPHGDREGDGPVPQAVRPPRRLTGPPSA